MENNKEIVKRFKGTLLLNVCSYLIIIGCFSVVSLFFPTIRDESLIYGRISQLSVVYIAVIFLLLLVRFYKACKVLKASGYLKVAPALLLCLVILGIPFFIIDIIIFLVILAKSNSYLKAGGLEKAKG